MPALIFFTRYAVTYVNAIEESPESAWSDTVEIPQKCTTVKVRKTLLQLQRYGCDLLTLIFDIRQINFEKIQFEEGDFAAKLKPGKKDGKTVPRDRGIKRRGMLLVFIYLEVLD